MTCKCRCPTGFAAERQAANDAGGDVQRQHPQNEDQPHSRGRQRQVDARQRGALHRHQARLEGRHKGAGCNHSLCCTFVSRLDLVIEAARCSHRHQARLGSRAQRCGLQLLAALILLNRLRKYRTRELQAIVMLKLSSRCTLSLNCVPVLGFAACTSDSLCLCSHSVLLHLRADYICGEGRRAPWAGGGRHRLPDRGEGAPHLQAGLQRPGAIDLSNFDHELLWRV